MPASFFTVVRTGISLHVHTWSCIHTGHMQPMLVHTNNVLHTIITHKIRNISTVESPNKGHLGTRASVLYSEVSEVRNVLALLVL